MIGPRVLPPAVHAVYIVVYCPLYTTYSGVIGHFCPFRALYPGYLHHNCTTPAMDHDERSCVFHRGLVIRWASPHCEQAPRPLIWCPHLSAALCPARG